MAISHRRRLADTPGRAAAGALFHGAALHGSSSTCAADSRRHVRRSTGRVDMNGGSVFAAPGVVPGVLPTFHL